VSDPLIDEDDASTPLSPEERDALIPSYITQRRELNEVEQIGVADADRWAFSRKRDVLTEEFLLQLHKNMFGDVWKWAGSIRTTEKNIGDVPVWRVQQDLRQLLDDVRAQIEFEAYSPDEIALRFHNRLTWIHPVPNGNGRLARLAADLLVFQLGRPRFTWGSGNLVPDTELRSRYIDAQHAADGQVIEPLIEFARS
jgi:Fic-DOC domain mobile mystery protein B